MELLDRYVQAVKSALPSAQREDLAAEIAADLQAQVDDREAALGRPLTDDETAAILKRYGHPRMVAGRYAKMQYLIGPLLLPFYWYTLRIVLICTVFLAFGIAAIKGTIESNLLGEIATAWGAFWGTMLSAFGAVTLIFAIVERTNAQRDPAKQFGLDRWDPRNLHPVAPLYQPRFSRISSALEFVFNGVVLYWLLDTARSGHASLLFMNSQLPHNFVWPFTFAPVWHALLAPTAVVVVVYAASIAVFLVRPAFLRLRIALRVLYNAYIVAVCAVLIAAPGLVTITGHPETNSIVATALRFGIAAAALIAAFEVYRDGRLLLPARSNAGTSSTLPDPL